MHFLCCFLCCLPFSLKFTFTPNIYTVGCKFFDLGKSKGFLNLHLLETQGGLARRVGRVPTESVPGFWHSWAGACDKGYSGACIAWRCCGDITHGDPLLFDFECRNGVCCGRRGGQLSGACRLTDTGHAPTEPSLLLCVEHCGALPFCQGRRGGQLSGAIRLTDSGHVPTEPLLIFIGACNDAAWDIVSRHIVWDAFHHLVHREGVYLDFGFRTGKLTVRVRQLFDWLGPGEDFLCALQAQMQFSLFLFGEITGVHPGNSWRCNVVLPPCLSGGPLSTQRRTVFPFTAAIWFFDSDAVATVFFSFAGTLGFWSCGTMPWYYFIEIDDDFAIFFSCFGEDGPFRLAGSLVGLQRQILLPVVSMLSNSSSTTSSVSVSFCAAARERQCVNALLASSIAREYASGLTPRPGQWGAQPCTQRPFSFNGTWLHTFGADLEHFLAGIVVDFVFWFNIVSVGLGVSMGALCRSGCMILLCYLCRLLLFGLRLKGGTCNCDNLLRAARSSTAAVPWRLGGGLVAFSPRLLTGMAVPKKKNRFSAGYSADLYILLLLVAALFGSADAANSRSPAGQLLNFQCLRYTRHISLIEVC